MNIVVKVLTRSFIVNTFLSIFKVIFGFLGKSTALVVDGIHSFSDLITDLIAIIGSKLANKPADSKHPYGHGKIEYIVSLFMGVIIILLGLGIIYEVGNSEIYVPSKIVILISLITIIIKLILANYILKAGKENKNNILIASSLESKTDALSSAVVLISAILMQFSSKIEYLMYADKIASIVVGFFIIKVGFDVLKENASTIIGEQETDFEYLEEIKNLIIEDKDIKEILELVVLKNGPYLKLIGEFAMTPSLTLIEAHDKIDVIEEKIKGFDYKIEYISIHMCPYID